MTTYICTLYYPPGDTHDLPHSVLLPSGPIKRPSQHSVAIWQLLSSSPSEEERGLRGERERVGVYRCILFQPILWCPVFFLFCTRNHVYVCNCRDWSPIYIYTYTHIHTHIYTYIYMYTPSYIYTCIHTYIHTQTCIYTYTHTHTHNTPTHAYTYICICTNYRGIRTSVLTYYIHIPNTPSLPCPHTPAPPPFHAFSLCGIHVPRSAARSCERRGREGGGEGGFSCIFLFLVWVFLCPISPKKDTTHQV